MSNRYMFDVKVEEPFLLRQMVIFPLTNGGGKFENVKPFREVKNVDVIETGTVEEATLKNSSPYHVFMLDGEEIYGGLQNRIVNTSVLVESRNTVDIPVSCVEEHRWEGGNSEFKPGFISFPSIRAVIAESVSNSLKRERKFLSNQTKVWNTITKKLKSMNVKSATSSMHDIFSSFDEEIERIVEEVGEPGDFNGLVVGIDGRVKWLDFFGDKELFKYYFKPLMKSYIIETMDKGGGKFITESNVKKFLEKLKKIPVRRYMGVDMGEEIRFYSKDVMGKALLVEEKPLHVSLFS